MPSAPHQWITTVSTSLQALGILCGAMWAVFLYEQPTPPGLQKNELTLDTKVLWAPMNTRDTCRMDFSATLKNDRTSPYVVLQTTLTGWLIDTRKLKLIPSKPNAPSNFDPAPIFSGELSSAPGVTLFYPPGPGEPLQTDLRGEYQYGESSSSTASFIFHKQPDTIVLIRLSIAGSKTVGSAYWFPDTVPDTPYSWYSDAVCGAKWK